MQSDGFQRRRVGPRRVMKGHRGEVDLAAGRRREFDRIRRRRYVGHDRQDFQQPLGRPGGALQIAIDLADRADRAGDDHREEDELGKLATGDFTDQHIAPADPQHQGDRAEHADHHQRGQHRPCPHPAHRDRECVVDPIAEARAVDGLVGKRLHRADRVHRFLDVAADIGDAVLGRARQPSHPAPEYDNRQHHQRHQNEHNGGQFHAGDRQHHRAADEHQHVAQGDRRARAHHHLEQGGVGGQAGENFSGLGGLEKTRRQTDHMVIYVAADIGDHALADPRNEIETGIGCRREHQNHAEKRQQRAVEQGRVAGGEALVDEISQADAERQNRRRGDGQGEDRAEDTPMIRR